MCGKTKHMRKTCRYGCMERNLPVLRQAGAQGQKRSKKVISDIKLKAKIFLGILLIIMAACATSKHKSGMTSEEKEKSRHRLFCKEHAGLGGVIQDTPEDYRKLALYQRCMERMTGERD